MGYNIEISVNILKETKFSEVEKSIEGMAEFYSCDNIYSLTEEDGTKKIPRYHCVYVIYIITIRKRNKKSVFNCNNQKAYLSIKHKYILLQNMPHL